MSGIHLCGFQHADFCAQKNCLVSVPGLWGVELALSQEAFGSPPASFPWSPLPVCLPTALGQSIPLPTSRDQGKWMPFSSSASLLVTLHMLGEGKWAGSIDQLDDQSEGYGGGSTLGFLMGCRCWQVIIHT